jgi:hypothetical protein
MTWGLVSSRGVVPSFVGGKFGGRSASCLDCISSALAVEGRWRLSENSSHAETKGLRHGVWAKCRERVIASLPSK